MKSWMKLIGVVVALVLVIAAAKGYALFKMFSNFKNQPAPVATVSTIVAAYQPWSESTSVIGTLRAERGADLAFEVAGVIDSIDFESGQAVRAGQPLIHLRAADDIAHLDSLKASADLAAATYKRDQAQFAVQAVSQATLDADAANLRSLQAQVAQQQALVDKKLLRAPFSGQLGVRWVDAGQYVDAGTKAVTLQQLDPILVDFYIPQQQIGQIATGEKLTVTTDAFPGRAFEGRVSAIDPKVDTDTRNVRVRGRLANPKHELLPGMFAHVEVEIGKPQRYLTLPSTAIAYNPYGATVFVVEAEAAGSAPSKPALKVRQVFVTTGATRGDQVAILKGIKEGDQIVTTGQIKLRNGSAVAVNNAVQPSDDPHPTPQEH
jgi:membrane fusion protein (multidrug efflux system)